jgi:hypothetical protein
MSLIEQIKARLKLLDGSQTPSMPEPDMPSYEFVRWAESTRKTIDETAIDIDTARAEMEAVIREYIAENPGHILLIAAPPGLGKTHSLVKIMQESGKRVGLFMDRHKMYDTMYDFDHFDNSLWYHWLSLEAKDPDNEDATMCMFAKEAKVWTSKGYSLMDMCRSLCEPCGHIKRCSYRRQASKKELCIAGVHEHSTNGMAMSYQTCFLDELPLRAFVKIRHIPVGDIYMKSGGPVHTFLKKIKSLCLLLGKQKLTGKPLLDMIGGDLSDVYAQVDDIGKWVPLIPPLNNVEDVHKAEYWYLSDLLLLLAPEYAAWKEGRESWLSRVILSSDGIRLLKRDEAWKNLPSRFVVLDATGKKETYEKLYGRKVVVWKPTIKRVGRIYQIVNRNNGKTAILGKDGKLTRSGLDAIETIRGLIRTREYKDVGVVTFKGVVDEVKELLGIERVVHFYGQRGSNLLKGCDAGFVLGCPSPNDSSVINTYAALYPDAMTPLSPKKIGGNIRPVRTTKEREYNYIREDGKSPRRKVGGFWWETELQEVYELFREVELIQSAHRARPLTQDCDVWLLTAIETGIRLDGLYERPEQAIGTPVGFNAIAWEKMLRWLDGLDDGAILTNKIIAEGIGVGESWVSRNKWLQAIAENLPEWQIDTIKKKPKTVVRAL